MQTLVSGLEISAPTAPVTYGIMVAIGWDATADDPLSFSLTMLCGGAITVQVPIERVISTNNTGQVSFGTFCLGCVSCPTHNRVLD